MWRRRKQLYGDFSVNSKGHCFLCLDQIPQRNTEPFVYPLQYLSHYLKMDIKKLFNDGSPIPPILVGKVTRSKLKVELCEECAKYTQKFSNLYRQLEMIKMEMGSCLSHIQERLSKADEMGKTEQFLERVEDDFNFRSGGLLELLGALRTEATQKCSQKLRTPQQPRVQIPAPAKTVKMDAAAKLKPTSQPRRPVKKPGPLSSRSKSNKPINKKQNKTDSTSISLADSPVTQFKRGRRGKNRWSFNPVTGKRTCNLCPYEFNTGPAFHYHYAKVHLHVKHQCNLCDKHFPYKASLHLHYQSAHQGLRFNCSVCQKSFTQNAQRASHQRECIKAQRKAKAKKYAKNQKSFHEEDNNMDNESEARPLNFEFVDVKMEAFGEEPDLSHSVDPLECLF